MTVVDPDPTPEVGLPEVMTQRRPPDRKLPLGEEACAAALGMTADELRRGRVPVAHLLYERGQALVAAEAEAARIVAEAKASLREVIGIAYHEWGMGYEAIAQNTGAVRLDPTGKRVRDKPSGGVITPTTAKRWAALAAAERAAAAEQGEDDASAA